MAGQRERYLPSLPYATIWAAAAAGVKISASCAGIPNARSLSAREARDVDVVFRDEQVRNALRAHPCNRLDCAANDVVGGIEHPIHVKENP